MSIHIRAREMLSLANDEESSFEPRNDRWQSMLMAQTHQYVHPWSFPRSVIGFQSYLSALKIRHFTAIELTRPKRPDLITDDETFDDAMRGSVFLPVRAFWPRLGLVAWLLEKIRSTYSDRMIIRHVWRPENYNKAIGGSSRSDHIECCAADIEVPSIYAKNSVKRFLERTADILWLSYGYNSKNGNRFHVGILADLTVSNGNPRSWDYGAIRTSLP